MKKNGFIILIFLIVVSFCFPVMAAKSVNLSEAIHGWNIDATDQFLVTITRPDGDETTFNKSYVICGMSDDTDIHVVLEIYDPSTEKYKDFKTVDGTNNWDVDENGLFTKEVFLKEGANKIKIIAYKESQAGSLELAKNLQVNYFTITALNESIKDKIMRSVFQITDLLKKF
jgi:hypothetical protein